MEIYKPVQIRNLCHVKEKPQSYNSILPNEISLELQSEMVIMVIKGIIIILIRFINCVKIHPFRIHNIISN